MKDTGGELGNVFPEGSDVGNQPDDSWQGEVSLMSEELAAKAADAAVNASYDDAALLLNPELAEVPALPVDAEPAPLSQPADHETPQVATVTIIGNPDNLQQRQQPPASEKAEVQPEGRKEQSATEDESSLLTTASPAETARNTVAMDSAANADGLPETDFATTTKDDEPLHEPRDTEVSAPNSQHNTDDREGSPGLASDDELGNDAEKKSDGVANVDAESRAETHETPLTGLADKIERGEIPTEDDAILLLNSFVEHALVAESSDPDLQTPEQQMEETREVGGLGVELRRLANSNPVGNEMPATNNSTPSKTLAWLGQLESEMEGSDQRGALVLAADTSGAVDKREMIPDHQDVLYPVVASMIIYGGTQPSLGNETVPYRTSTGAWKIALRGDLPFMVAHVTVGTDQVVHEKWYRPSAPDIRLLHVLLGLTESLVEKRKGDE